ncbi:MAG: ABC transporter ATP-binding protein, partial [Oscillospiraceae bacterium]|nr:ABC transporter ATP-binding protein [Oscillospiraceae bacterium]
MKVALQSANTAFCRFWGEIMFLLRWLWKNMEGSRKIYACGLLCTFICQSMYIIVPRISATITDTFIVNEHAAENLEEKPMTLVWLLAVMVGITLVRAAIEYLSTMCYEHASQAMIYRIRGVVFKNIEEQDAKFYDLYRTGDIMTRVSGDLDMVRHSIAWIIRVVLECVIMFTASVVFFVLIDWLMALCLIALTPLILVIAYHFERAVGPKFRKKRDKLSDLNTAAEENISGNRVVKAFAREDHEANKFDKLSSDYRDASKDASFTWLKYFPLEEITAQALSVVM